MTPEWTPRCQTLTVLEDGVAVCQVTGDLDSSNIKVFHQAVIALSHFPAAVLDLSRVGFIDSAGLGAVIAAARRGRERRCTIVIVSVRPHTTRLFRTVGIDRIVPVVASIEEALAVVAATAMASADRHEPATGSSDHRRAAM